MQGHKTSMTQSHVKKFKKNRSTEFYRIKPFFWSGHAPWLHVLFWFVGKSISGILIILPCINECEFGCVNNYKYIFWISSVTKCGKRENWEFQHWRGTMTFTGRNYFSHLLVPLLCTFFNNYWSFLFEDKNRTPSPSSSKMKYGMLINYSILIIFSTKMWYSNGINSSLIEILSSYYA